MRNETEEAILRDLESKNPPMSAEFEHTLRNLARLAQLIEDDVAKARRAPQREREDALHEIERKANVLSDWLIGKADQCAGDGPGARH